jgi:3-methylcrotonyl-CoA carboxylase alpha subunit
MIAKIIAHASSRGEALDRLAVALRSTVVVGPRVNTPLLTALAEHPEFRAGCFDTGFIDRYRDDLLAADPAAAAQAIADGVAALLEQERARIAGARVTTGRNQPSQWRNPWSANDGFSLGSQRAIPVDVVVDGVTRTVDVVWGSNGPRVTVDGPEGIAHDTAGSVVRVADGVVVLRSGRQYHVALKRFDAADAGSERGDGAVLAPMNGRIVAVLVVPGQRVARGARVALMEAMKMEHSLNAPIDGTVTAVAAEAGAAVVAGATVVRIAADAVEP